MEHALGLVVRATATYVFLLVLLRVSGKRTVGEGTPFDLVVALVLGDFPDDLIWGDVPVAQGLVAMGAVMVAHLCVVYASFRSVRFDRLVGSGPTPIVRNGRVVPKGLRREHMNEGDVDVVLRHHRRPDRREVQEALLEPDGELSLRPTETARIARRRDVDAGRAA